VATTALGVGTKTIDMPLGTYTVSGSVSGYSHSVEVNMDTTEVAAYPAGAIYWYGREVVAMTTSLSGGYSSAHATENTNNIDLYAWANSNGDKASFAQTVTASKVDTSKYATIKYKINVTSIYEKYSQGVAQIRYGYKADTVNSNLPSSVLTSGNSTFSLASPGTSTHIAVTAYTSWGGYSGNYQARCYVYAIWME
jgi:hypothetical protein